MDCSSILLDHSIHSLTYFIHPRLQALTFGTYTLQRLLPSQVCYCHQRTLWVLLLNPLFYREVKPWIVLVEHRYAHLLSWAFLFLSTRVSFRTMDPYWTLLLCESIRLLDETIKRTRVCINSLEAFLTSTGCFVCFEQRGRLHTELQAHEFPKVVGLTSSLQGNGMNHTYNFLRIGPWTAGLCGKLTVHSGF